MERPDNLDRRSFIRLIGGGAVMAAPFMGVLSAFTACTRTQARDDADELFVSNHFTEPGTFLSGIEEPTIDGPAVDMHGNVYAANVFREHTIARVTPEGELSVFAELPGGSTGSGIRFNSRGDMLIADYINHNVLRIDMQTRAVSVYAQREDMNRPNDLAIGANDILYASDPDWDASTGKLWRIDTDGSTTLLEDNMGTTNGIEVGSDEKTLYVNESVERNVWAYDLSPDGEIDNKRLLIRFPDYGMDGMRCDIDGNLYITRKGRGRSVVVVSPEGKVIREITMRGGWIANNLDFGGPDGRTVYVTMAYTGNIQMFRTDRPGRSWALHRKRMAG